MQLKKKMAWSILLVAVLPVVWVLWSIDDWRRDWTTNFAETEASSEDPWLRPLRSHHSPAVQADRIAAWVDGQRNWDLAAVEAPPAERAGMPPAAATEEASGRAAAPGPSTSGPTEAGIVRMRFVRTTPLLRFRDDIYVVLSPTADGGSLLEATSQSRVGKGDLGQNPRNLRELLQAIAE